VSDSNPLSRILQTIVACALFGGLAYWATLKVLGFAFGGTEEQEPVVYDAATLAMEDARAADIHAAAQLVRERWSYLDHRSEISGLDLDALTEEALSILEGEGDHEVSFERAMTRFVAGLEDGHAFVQFAQWKAPGAWRWPFRLLEVKEGVMITSVADGVTDAVPGDILFAVDDRPIEDWIVEMEDFVFASTPTARRHAALEHLMSWDREKQRRFRIRRASGEEFEWVAALPASHTKVPPLALLSRERKHEVLDGNIGFFRPGNFSPPPNRGWPGPPEGRDAILADSYAEIDSVFEELEGCSGLILDLRGNPGGTDLLGQFLVDRLVKPGYTYSRLAVQGNNRWGRFSTHGSSAPKGEHFLRVPTICLLDEGTFSTADNVAACLADVHPDIRFVGRPNGAGTGAPRSFELPRTGTRITFCTMQVKTPNGRMGEGISVELDHPVQWTREDVLRGRDPDLAAGLGLLTEG
jgi:hypothetical protein